MKKHPTVVTATSGSALGRQIMELRYDELLKVVSGMKREARRQSKNDHDAGKIKLASALNYLLLNLVAVEGAVTEIVKICEPYIEAEKNSNQ